MKQVTDPEELARHILGGKGIIYMPEESSGGIWENIPNHECMEFCVHDVIEAAKSGEYYYPEATNDKG